VRETLIAKFAGETAPSQTVADATANGPRTIELDFEKPKPYREPKNPVMWTAVASQSIPAGATGAIQFTATPDRGFHVYTSAVDDANSSTNFVVTQKSGLQVGAPTTPAAVILDNKIPSLPLKYHPGKVTWSLPVSIPAGTPAGEHNVEGFIVYQACTENACHPPAAMKFKTTIAVGDSGNKGTAVILTAAKRAIALDAAAETKWVDAAAGNAAEPAANDQSMAPPPVVPEAQPPEPDPNQSASVTADAPPMDFGTTDSHTSDAHASGEALSHSSPPVPFIESDTAAPAIASTVVKDSPELIAEMAKLYDPDEKIRYLTLQDMDANPVGSGGVSSSNQTTFWSAMFGAFVGGMILNLMPCVFPVLGLKVMGFVKQAGSDPAKIRMHGIAFAAGLMVAMWVLAGIILAIKLSLGQDINWGAQMGNPYFVCSMIVLLFLLGLNMAGVFEFGTSMTRVGGTVQGKEGYTSSFLSGVLTTLVATPCSGPFLGAAMSYTLAQPAGVAMILFTVFALGIAMPYLLLCFFPALINKLPRPGAWMETFKVTMAFALFATVAFFMQAFGNQTGVGGLSWLAMALVVIGLAAFYYGNYSAPHVSDGKRWAFGYVMPLAIFVLGGWMCFSAANERSVEGSTHNAGGLAWQDWNPGKVEYTLNKSQRPVWVDYTAHW
jgi:thiol:disulfide interchange protein DsbD